MADPYIIKTEKKKFRVEENRRNEIGRGIYGTVYKGTDPGGEVIAAKCIPEKHTIGFANVKLNKIQTVTKKLIELSHKNLTKFLDMGFKGDDLWLFMEYSPTGDLQKLYKSKRNLSIVENLRLMKQIAEGIDFLHDNQVVHRDIKPSNILIFHDPNQRPVPKLVDFDFSKILDPELETSGMSSDVGTFQYKAPEFFDEENIHYQKNVDIFAAGLTFLAMLQGLRDDENWLKPEVEFTLCKKKIVSIGEELAKRFELSMVVEKKSEKKGKNPLLIAIAVVAGVVVGAVVGGVAGAVAGPGGIMTGALAGALRGGLASATGAGAGAVTGGVAIAFMYEGGTYIKYGEKCFNDLDRDTSKTARRQRAAERRLIQEMVFLRPEHRLASGKVVAELERIIQLT